MMARVERWRARALPVVAATSCVVAPVLMALAVRSPVRAVAALALFSLAPGAALLPALDRRLRGRLELGVVVAVSLAVSVLLAQGMVMAGAFAAPTATYAIAGVCLPLIVWHLARLATTRGAGR